ncbi:unnamed protein product [Closterium sp. Naga37s-1]|nr:unnamed protein product [Closterium sp. Naga37s-1]
MPPAPQANLVANLVAHDPTFEEYLKWLAAGKPAEDPPAPSNQAVDQGAEAGHVAAATAGPGVATEGTALWGTSDLDDGVDPEILAGIVMPDPEIEVMREKLAAAAAPTVEAQQRAPAASSAPAFTSATGAKSPPAGTGEVGDGKQKRKGKAKAGSSKGTANAAPQGRKGSGVRVDKDTGLVVAEMKFGRKSRYICRSFDKTEAAYCSAVAVSAFDGYVRDVILDEFAGVEDDVMKEYRLQELVKEYNRLSNGKAALSVALCPALWLRELLESTKPEKLAKTKMAADMITRAALCAAFAPGAAKVTPVPDVELERLPEILTGTSCAVWCFSETNATLRGASEEFTHRCKSVIEVVLQRASSRTPSAAEVADTVTKVLQEDVLRSLPEDWDEKDHDEVIAHVMIENLAFWGTALSAALNSKLAASFCLLTPG